MDEANTDLQTLNQPSHHLLRIRVYRRNYEKLKQLAEQETIKQGEFISISDLVRGAISSLLQNQDTRNRLDVIRNPNFKVRKG